MFKSLKSVTYQVADLEKTKQWYCKILQCEPAVDSPLAVIFEIGDFGLTLKPTAKPSQRSDERVVAQALRNNIPQLVFLGAGYDTRPYRFANLIRETRIFELDIASTQQRKKQLLHQANVLVPAQLAFVSIDFERDTLAEALIQAGFDGNKKTLFIWEGVTYYLSARAVDETLAFVKSHSPASSIICFDYMVHAPDMSGRYGVKAAREAMRATYAAESLQFGIEEGTIESYLSERGFKLIEHLTPEDMERKYLTLRNGSSAGKVLALFCFAQAAVMG